MPVPWTNLVYEQSPVTIWSAGAPTDLIVPRTGLYLCTVGLLLSAPITALWAVMNIRVAGGFVGGNRQALGGQSVQLNASGVFEAQLGDVVDITAQTNSTTIQGGARSHVTLTRIGPERWTG